MIPLLADRRRAGARALLAALAAATLALTLLWVAVPGWTYNFADGRTYLLDYLSQQVGADAARLFPSSVRPRVATWIWPVAITLVTCLLWVWPRWRPKRAAIWGVAALLLLTAAIPRVAGALPSTTIELEDPYVRKSGGHLYPDRWIIERTRYRGGWVLREGEQLDAPVVPGGRRFTLTLDAFFVRNQPRRLVFDVSVGGEHLTRGILSRPGRWWPLELGTFDWPEGADSIRIEIDAAPGEGPPNGVVLDRMGLTWAD